MYGITKSKVGQDDGAGEKDTKGVGGRLAGGRTVGRCS